MTYSQETWAWAKPLMASFDMLQKAERGLDDLFVQVEALLTASEFDQALRQIQDAQDGLFSFVSKTDRALQGLLGGKILSREDFYLLRSLSIISSSLGFAANDIS